MLGDALAERLRCADERFGARTVRLHEAANLLARRDDRCCSLRALDLLPHLRETFTTGARRSDLPDLCGFRDLALLRVHDGDLARVLGDQAFFLLFERV